MLIPLDETLLIDCIDVEKRVLAGLEGESVEKEECVKNIEKLYDVLCKRYAQREGMLVSSNL